jgi:hypothetical protein
MVFSKVIIIEIPTLLSVHNDYHNDGLQAKDNPLRQIGPTTSVNPHLGGKANERAASFDFSSVPTSTPPKLPVMPLTFSQVPRTTDFSNLFKVSAGKAAVPSHLSAQQNPDIEKNSLHRIDASLPVKPLRWGISNEKTAAADFSFGAPSNPPTLPAKLASFLSAPTITRGAAAAHAPPVLTQQHDDSGIMTSSSAMPITDAATAASLIPSGGNSFGKTAATFDFSLSAASSLPTLPRMPVSFPPAPKTTPTSFGSLFKLPPVSATLMRRCLRSLCQSTTG